MYSVAQRKDQAHSDGVWGLAWSKSQPQDRELILTASVDGTVKVWNWDDKNSSLSHRWTLEGHQLGVVSVTTNRAGDLAASSGLDGFIKVWDLNLESFIKNIEGGPVDVWTVAFSMDSSHIATGSHNGKINIFKVEDGKKETVLGTAGKLP
eukprot:Em0010g471a